MAGALALLIRRAGVPTPFQDELVFWPLYQSLVRNEFPPLTELIAAHNGHPYLLLKALISVTLLGGLPWTWMMYAQVVVLVLCALVAVGARAGRVGIMASAIVITVVLSPRQWENLYWAMQLAFPLSLLFSLVAFSAVDNYARLTPNAQWAFVALVSGLAASVSNGAGIFALGLACVALMAVSDDLRVRAAAVLALVAGVALFVYAQALAPRSGVGSASIDLSRAIEHAVRMLAHQFLDASPGSPITLALGIAVALLIAYVVAIAAPAWRKYLFELLCIALSLLLIAGVTYSRVTAGIFQPDAPRYLPLLAPLTIGTALILDAIGRRALLVAMLAVVGVGYVAAVRAEWRISPHRQQNALAAHQELCVSGRVHPIHNMRLQLRGTALSDIRTLFCSGLATHSRQLDHGNIGGSAASGFYQEERHTWISPRLEVLLPPGPPPTRVEVAGWLPDTNSYAEGRFLIEIATGDSVLAMETIERAGDFSVAADLPAAIASLEVRASARRPVPGDARMLSWILVSIVFR
jgi:hypothetical protein